MCCIQLKNLYLQLTVHVHVHDFVSLLLSSPFFSAQDGFKNKLKIFCKPYVSTETENLLQKFSGAKNNGRHCEQKTLHLKLPLGQCFS
jgi:hypothetical protein